MQCWMYIPAKAFAPNMCRSSNDYVVKFEVCVEDWGYIKIIKLQLLYTHWFMAYFSK